MALSRTVVNDLRDSIKDGSFPDSNELLNSDLTVDTIPSLLAALSESRQELSNDIRVVSKDSAGDVDEWIAQAKKVQDDIARCKVEARNIVQEHEKVEALRRSAKDAHNRADLLEAEVAFTKMLEHEFEAIADISEVLNQADNDFLEGRTIDAVDKLLSIEASIDKISASQTRSVLRQLQEELSRKSRESLEKSLDSRWIVNRDKQKSELEVVTSAPRDTQLTAQGHASRVLQALSQLGAADEAEYRILQKLEGFIIPLISEKSTLKPSSVAIVNSTMTIGLGPSRPSVRLILTVMKEVVQFLHSNLPELIRDSVAGKLLPKLLLILIPVWLDPAIPSELDELKQLDSVQKDISELSGVLLRFSWPGHQELSDWTEQIPRTWVSRRKMRSLNAVRNAFAVARGTTREVERVERQVVAAEPPADAESNEDDWNANWDEEDPLAGTKPADNSEDDDASGWDFETESNHSQSDEKEKPTDRKPQEDEDDSGEAWGWGDDTEDLIEGKPQDKVVQSQPPINGIQPSKSQKQSQPKEQEMVLKETYIITDIPDHILEVIGKDLQDLQEVLSSTPEKFFNTSSSTSIATSGLQSIPTQILAIFRATAPTYYSLPSNLNLKSANMNLYNDTLYIIQKLNEISITTTSSSNPLSINTLPLSKFSTYLYTSELSTQRQILTDILDGAQGFTSCTKFPFSQQCIAAVEGVVSHITTLHTLWSGILGSSHLLQSIGSLLTTVITKMITDIEDMEDISEPESAQLVKYCQDISSLDKLFVPNAASSHLHGSAAQQQQQQQQAEDEPEAPVSMVLLYVPNYLRFQYLTQILESSLVDIKYLWTEGELALEFTADEVTDLIRALFAESSHRRNAISAIRG